MSSTPCGGSRAPLTLDIKNRSTRTGVGTPRKMGVEHSMLPDALTVSSRLIWSRNDPHEHLTALAAIWGQFIAHDISYTLPLSGYERVRSPIIC